MSLAFQQLITQEVGPSSTNLVKPRDSLHSSPRTAKHREHWSHSGLQSTGLRWPKQARHFKQLSGSSATPAWESQAARSHRVRDTPPRCGIVLCESTPKTCVSPPDRKARRLRESCIVLRHPWEEQELRPSVPPLLTSKTCTSPTAPTSGPRTGPPAGPDPSW